MDFSAIITGLTVIGFVYGFLRNFKIDMISHFDKLEKRMDRCEQRTDQLEERIFMVLTGKKLEDAILDERMKRDNNLGKII